MELAPQTGSFWQGPAIDGLALGGRRGCKQPLVAQCWTSQPSRLKGTCGTWPSVLPPSAESACQALALALKQICWDAGGGTEHQTMENLSPFPRSFLKPSY